MQKVKVITHANLALIKYWGKRDTTLMLPTKGSIGLSLSALETTTYMSSNKVAKDIIFLDSRVISEQDNPITKFLDAARSLLGINKYFSIDSKNSFPTASGLASSASGFAALALGIDSLCNLNLSMQEISILARLGSGSAARSVYGGYVFWDQGKKQDGTDCYAKQIFQPSWWPELRVIIATTTQSKKEFSSRYGMQQSVETSPTYTTWLNKSQGRIKPLLKALEEKDIAKVGAITEEDWTDLKEVMLTTQPSLNYWTTTSYAIIDKVIALREQKKINCYVTTDAGPHVKIICLADDAAQIMQTLGETQGLVSVIESHISGNPTVEIQ